MMHVACQLNAFPCHLIVYIRINRYIIWFFLQTCINQICLLTAGDRPLTSESEISDSDSNLRPLSQFVGEDRELTAPRTLPLDQLTSPYIDMDF